MKYSLFLFCVLTVVSLDLTANTLYQHYASENPTHIHTLLENTPLPKCYLCMCACQSPVSAALLQYRHRDLLAIISCSAMSLRNYCRIQFHYNKFARYYTSAFTPALTCRHSPRFRFPLYSMLFARCFTMSCLPLPLLLPFLSFWLNSTCCPTSQSAHHA